MNPIININEATSISISNEVLPPQYNLLCTTIWGNVNKTQYVHLDTYEKLHAHTDWIHINLTRKKNLLATVTLVPHEYDNKYFNFVRYFSFENKLTTQSSRPLQKPKNSILKNKFNQLLNGIGDLQPTRPNFYAYVELENERSKNLCQQFEFKKVGEFTTTIFGRINPIKRVELTNENINRDDINATYNHYNFFHQDNLKGNQWAFKINDETVISAVAQQVKWKIINLPGLTGKLVKIISHIPKLNKLISKEQMDFVTLEGLWIKPGFENHLSDFLESLLAELNQHSIFFWLDKNDPQLKIIKNLKLGILEKFNDGIGADIIYRGDESLIDKNQPFYISPYDMT